MLTKERLEEWLESYLRPQEQLSADKIRTIFADDAEYWWGPFHPVRRGVTEIYEHHRNALAHQRNLRYDYNILATADDYGISRFHLHLTELMEGEPEEYDGIFLVYLNEQGKCVRFEEWYHSK